MKLYNPFKSQDGFIVFAALCVLLFVVTIPLGALLFTYPLFVGCAILLGLGCRVLYYIFRGR